MMFSEAINARQKSIEHLCGLPLAFSSEEFEIRQDTAEGKPLSPERLNGTFSEKKALELLRQAAIYGVWQCPTLTLRARMALANAEQLANDPNLKYVPHSVRHTWDDPRQELSTASPHDLPSATQPSPPPLHLL